MQTFNDYSLSKEILKAIHDLGFVNPTPIQEKVIPEILEKGTDIIGLAQTGTGKTAGFGLPILEQLNIGSKNVQSLILCPTRELCMQITSDLEKFAKYMPKVSILSVYGGTSIVPQINSLKKGAHIVVGTPGRTLDLIKRKILSLKKIRWVVLDEADEMLNMGFKDDLDAILEDTPETRQSLLFSATMPTGVKSIAGNYMKDPVEIRVGKKNEGAKNVEHQYFVVKAADRYKGLKRLADINPSIYGIVFCRTRRETKDVADKLIQDGYNADALHGDLSQAQRDSVMQRFRKGHLQLLVATDVAARGLDVQDLSHIINYNLPDDPEIYVHRSGRTGRAGKYGISMTITHSREGRRIKELENIVGKKFKYMQIPGGREICEKRLFNVVDKVEKVVVDEDLISSFLPTIEKKLSWLTREDLIKHFISVEFNRFLDYYKNAGDLNVLPEKGRDEGKKRGGNTSFTRMYINLGSKVGMNASHLIGLINEATKRNDIEIGKVDIQRNFSFFEIDKDYDNEALKAFKDTVYEDIPVRVDVSEGEIKPDRHSSRNRGKGGSKGSSHRGQGGYKGGSKGGSKGNSTYRKKR